MRAVTMREFGGEDVLRLEDVPDPVAGPGQVLVRVAAVEVSRTRDVATRTGRHPFSQFVTLPHILGGDFGGVIEAAGEGVDPALVGHARRRLQHGDVRRMRGLPQRPRGAVRRSSACSASTAPAPTPSCAAIAAENAHPIPADLTLQEAAALAADGSIAFTQLQVAGVGPGTKLLVTGVTGALGSTLAALGAHLGADVIGLSRRPGEVPAEFELAANLDATDPNLTEALLEATDGAGHRCGHRQRRQPGGLRRLLPGPGDRRPGRLLRGDRQPRAAGPAGAGGAALRQEHLAARRPHHHPDRPPQALGGGRRRLPPARRVDRRAAARAGGRGPRADPERRPARPHAAHGRVAAGRSVGEAPS